MKQLLIELGQQIPPHLFDEAWIVDFITDRITPQELQIYGLIKYRSGITAAEISDQSGIKINQINNILSDFKRANLVQRELVGGIFRYSCKE